MTRNLLGSAFELGRRALIKGLDAASRLRTEEDAPLVVADAPKPGRPGAPKSGTAARTPAQAANGAAAGAEAVPTGRSTPRRKAAAKRTTTTKPAAAKRKPARAAAAKRTAASKPAATGKPARKTEPAATANAAGATRKPGAVPTGRTVTSETAKKPEASRRG